MREPSPAGSGLPSRAAFELQQRRISRRSVLKGGLGVAGLSLLAACTKSGGTVPPTTAGGGSSSAAGGSGLSQVDVGFAYIGPHNDNGWTQTHDIGRQAIEQQLGSKAKTSYVENVPISAEAGQTFEQLASKNQLVIANTEYANFLGDVAARHPDVAFLECDGHAFTSNLSPYYVAHQNAAYQLGVAAGKLAENGKIGYVGAFPTATAYNDVNPICLGARTINPNATVQAVMISSFFDPQKATQATNALIDGGVQFIFSVMDEPSFLQVCQKRGVWGASWNLDIRQFGPDVYVNTYALDWRSYYVEQATAVLNGTWKPTTEPRLLPVDLGAWGDKVPQDVQDAVAEAKSKIDGGFDPYTGPITDDKGTVRLQAGESLSAVQAYAIDWAVEGVSGVT